MKKEVNIYVTSEKLEEFREELRTQEFEFDDQGQKEPSETHPHKITLTFECED